MLTEQQIQQALKASRVAPVGTTSPHGPLGLEQLASDVDALRGAQRQTTVTIPVRPETFARLQHLAAERRGSAHPVTPADIAAAIVERFVSSLST